MAEMILRWRTRPGPDSGYGRGMRALIRRVAGLVLVVAACRPASPRSPTAVDPRPIVDAIQLCRTTGAALREALGPPTRDGRLGDARVLSWITGEDAVVHYLAVRLDAADRVVDLYWDLPTEIPWQPIDRCAADA
jgi:hypothetical protein